MLNNCFGDVQAEKDARRKAKAKEMKKLKKAKEKAKVLLFCLPFTWSQAVVHEVDQKSSDILEWRSGTGLLWKLYTI